MGTSLTVEEIIAAAKDLSPEERAKLLRALTKNDGAAQRHITEIHGIGKEVWQGIDAQAHINSERDSWER